MPKKNRVAIYTFLFSEGVLCVKKEVKKGKHDLIDVPNLHVMKLMQSLESRGYVREVFNWQWKYFFLTDEGVEFLRTYLNLPSEVAPATHKAPQRTQVARGVEDRRREGGFGRGRGEREGGYRREGGFGRGRGAPAAVPAQ